MIVETVQNSGNSGKPLKPSPPVFRPLLAPLPIKQIQVKPDECCIDKKPAGSVFKIVPERKSP